MGACTVKTRYQFHEIKTVGSSDVTNFQEIPVQNFFAKGLKKIIRNSSFIDILYSYSCITGLQGNESSSDSQGFQTISRPSNIATTIKGN